MAYTPTMPNDWDGSDQKVPKPKGFQGSDEDAWIMTMHDGRLGYEPGTGDITTLEQVREMRNPRPIRKH